MNIKKIITSAAVLSVMACSAAAPVSQNHFSFFSVNSITADAARSATYTDVDNFFKKCNGRGFDVDGCAGVQCVDLISKYMTDVFSISNSTLNAKEYWNNFGSYSFLYNNFTKIPNTKEFVPQKGDIVVWTRGQWGHVAIATGDGTTSWFTSYEQNTTGNHDATKLVKNNYSGVAGVLRCKYLKGSGGSDPYYSSCGLAGGTVWVSGDTYIFNNTQTMYKDKACKTSAGTIKSGQKKVFTNFYQSGSTTVGKTSDGYYIRVRTSNALNVNAYVTVNCDTLNVRKGAGTSYGIVTTMRRGKTVRVTKYSGDWAYSPDVNGWFTLEYVRG